MENKVAEEMASSLAMENRGAEGVQIAPAEKEAPAVVEKATFMESAKDQLRQFKDAVAGEYWISLKNRVRDAGVYATLRTRQGISMFGEPKIGAINVIVDHC